MEPVRTASRPGAGPATPARPTGRPPVVTVGPSPAPGMVRVRVRADLDLATVEQARVELASVLDTTAPSGCVAVHLGVDRFVDLRGMRMLLQAADRVRGRGGALVVVAPSATVRLLVGLLGCRDELPTAPTAEDAVRWWARPR